MAPFLAAGPSSFHLMWYKFMISDDGTFEKKSDPTLSLYQELQLQKSENNAQNVNKQIRFGLWEETNACGEHADSTKKGPGQDSKS